MPSWVEIFTGLSGLVVVVGGLSKTLQFLGGRVRDFVRKEVIPPITELSNAVKQLSEHVDQSRAELAAFVDAQSLVNNTQRDHNSRMTRRLVQVERRLDRVIRRVPPASDDDLLSSDGR